MYAGLIQARVLSAAVMSRRHDFTAVLHSLWPLPFFSDPSSMMFLEPRWAVLPITTKHSTTVYSEIGSLVVLESVEEDID